MIQTIWLMRGLIKMKKKKNIYLIRFPKVWRALLKGVIIHDGRYVTSEIDEG